MSIQIDTKYIGLVSHHLQLFKKKTDRLYSCRCPLCGDSKKNRFKTRGYFYEYNGGFMFKCHNCSASVSLQKFLEQVDQTLANAYRVENFANKSKTESNVIPLISDKPNNVITPDIDLNLPNISDLPPTHRAVQYLQGRKIPIERYRDLYYCRNMAELERLNDAYENRLPTDERIIIPFVNADNKIVGLTGRSMGTSSFRYATIRLKNCNAPLIYGLNRIDFTKTIRIVEGQFDSMFVDNCIAPGGTDFNRAVGSLPREQLVLILDNQPRNKDVVRKVEYFCKYNFNLVIWPTTWIYKDINEAIIHGVTQPEIMNILNNNTFSGLALRLAIRDWKKC